MKAERAEHTVASGAWKGGFMDEMTDGVKTSTLGGDFSPADVSLAVRRGRKACMVRMGWRRCVLKRSAKLEGGMVAIGDVW